MTWLSPLLPAGSAVASDESGLARAAQIAEIVGVCVGAIGLAVAGIGVWVAVVELRRNRAEAHLRADHRLYIPAPDWVRQSSLEPEFWVYPPVPLADQAGAPDGYALVVAGELLNSGPSDALSLAIFACPELPKEHLVKALGATAEFIAEQSGCHRDEALSTLHLNLLGYDSLDPLLRPGDSKRFVVTAKLPVGNPYLDQLLKEQREFGRCRQTLAWEHDGKQAHPVNAASLTVDGRDKRWRPEDLCAPSRDSG